METKSIRVLKANLPLYKEDQAAFGWKFVGQSKSKGKFCRAYFSRDEKMPNYGIICTIEKNYNKVSKSFPLGSVIWFLISMGFLSAYIIFIKEFWSFAFLVAFISTFAVALLLLIMFFLVATKKRKLQELYIEEARRLSGVAREFPYAQCIVKPGKFTYIIKRKLKIIIRNLKNN